jgi:hypothetical protein
MARLLDHRLQLLAGMEGHDAPRADRDLLAGLGIAAGALRLVAQLEVAETGQLDAFAALQRAANLFEKGLDRPPAFSARPSRKQIASSAFCRLTDSPVQLFQRPLDVLNFARIFAGGDQRVRAHRFRAVGSFSILHNYPVARLFRSGGSPNPVG